MHLEPWAWALAIFGAFFIGLSKTGIAGLGMLAVTLFSSVFAARRSVGIVLVLLICADLVAVKAYHAHAVWKHLWRLFPWTLAGVVLGWFCMGKLDEAHTRRLIGSIILVLVLFQMLQRWKKDLVPPMHGMVYVALMGLAAGFTTLVANAAGPIMLLYLLATGLPKMEFMGTGAVYFLILNCTKVPFIYSLGLIDLSSLSIDLALAPVAAAGAFFGKRLLPYINQKAFETLALAASLAAAIKLLM